MDSNLIGSQSTRSFEIKIRKEDFTLANNCLQEEAEKNIDISQVDSNHYLFQFTDAELYSMLAKPDEWSEFDYKLSKAILESRGQQVSPSLVDSLKKERLKDLAQPEKSQKNWIYTGYFFSLLGGFLGVLIGWFIWNDNKILPDGTRVYSYSESDRKHGKRIFLLGVVIFPILFYLRIIR